MSWSLASVSELREELRLPAAAAAADEARLLRLLEDVSAGIEGMLGRRLRREENSVTLVDGIGGSVLHIPEHARIDSIAADLDGDGSWETDVPLAAVTQVLVHGAVTTLALRSGAPLAAWPSGAAAIRITGMLGLGDSREALGVMPSGVDAGSAVITLPPGARPGDTLIVDSERIYVRSSAGDVLRGAGGTSPAAHGAGAPAWRETWPRALSRAALLQAARLHREGLEAYAAAGGGELIGPTLSTAYPVVRDLLAPYRRIQLAVA